jgi:hypothetical protein
LPNSWGIFKSYPLALVKILDNSIVKESFAIGAAAINVYSSDDAQEQVPKKKWAGLKLSDDLYELYNGTIPKAQLDDLITKQAITLVANQLIIAKLALDLADYSQNLDKYFINLDTAPAAWQNFLIAHKSLAFFVLPYASGYINNHFMDNYLTTKLSYMVEDQFNYKYMDGETALHLAQNSSTGPKDSNVLVKNKNEDISMIIQQGNFLLTHGFAEVIQGGYGMLYLGANNVEDIIIYSAFYKQLTNEITYRLAVTSNSFNEEIDNLSTKRNSLDEYVKVNALHMIQTAANDFITCQRVEMDNQLRTLKEAQALWGTLNGVWLTAESTLTMLYNYIVIARKIHQGKLK